jgi:GNAT superfamily N-acetyltransferase
MYWILGAEYHRRPRSTNKEQLCSTVKSGQAPGLLAFDETGTALGWCRLNPREELHWLNRKRDLGPVDDVPVWSLSCFYVRSGSRGAGVMTALIGAAIDQARAAGAIALEAYPIDTHIEGATRNLFPGTVSAFTGAGFTVVARRAQDRPIMRRYLNT